MFITASTSAAIYTLSLRDALPISDEWLLDDPGRDHDPARPDAQEERARVDGDETALVDADRPPGSDDLERLVDMAPDRKSTRLNSSHPSISYAVFCLKKTKTAIWH